MQHVDHLIPEKKEREYIDSRINDIESAAQRSRWVYGLVIAVSWIIMAMAFNTTLSFMRDFAEAYETKVVAPSAVVRPPVNGAGSASTNPPEAAPERPGAVGRDIMIQQLLRNWVDSISFDVPVVGARFSGTDAGIVGGALLCILAIWCRYSLRRENHLVYYLVRDSQKFATDTRFRKYLKNQLHATQLFGRARRPEPLDANRLFETRGSNLSIGGPCEVTLPAATPVAETTLLKALQGDRTWEQPPDYIQITCTQTASLSLPHDEIDQHRRGPWQGQTSAWNTHAADHLEIPVSGRWSLAGQERKDKQSRLLRLDGRLDWRPLAASEIKRARRSSRSWVATGMIFFLPPIALAMVNAGDWWTLWRMDSPVRHELADQSLYDVLCEADCGKLWSRLVASLGFFAANLWLMIGAYRYQNATNSLLSFVDQPCWTRIRR